ncbi:MAG: hypothetical protein SGJ05_04945 [bacterium]|nr:hypothetical protein [bacterium]
MKTLAAFLLVGAILTGCGGKLDEAAQGLKSMENLAESAKDAQATQDVVEKRREERRAKGDTVSLPVEELKAYLPADISGYTAEEPETSSTDMPGFSFSQASRVYRRADGATIKLQLTDYNNGTMGYASMGAIFGMKWRVDNKDETSGTFQTGDPMINGHERFEKSTKNTTLMYGLGGRFILNVEAEKQDVAFARSVAEKVDLKKLASK